jgi:glycosyltransferase involved in cell wall biosynthesis
MRICLVSLDYKPYRSSGLTLYAEDLATGLMEQGHAVTVIAAHRPGLPAQQQIDQVTIHRAAIDRFDWITYSWRAATLVDELQEQTPFDIVHFLDVHFAYHYPAPFVASLWQSFRQRSTAAQGWPYHTGMVDLWRRLCYYQIARRCMEEPSLVRAQRLLASCQSTADEFLTHYQVPPQKVDRAPQGINTTLFRPMAAHELRQRLGLSTCFVLLFMGFITPRKGLEYLAQAMQRLPDNVHLVIAGRWSHGYRQRVFRALGAAQTRVHEVGFIADWERPLYYSMADLYVSPSFLEGLGATPIEALACETPAIVTAATSGPEEIGPAGLVVPPFDGKALAEAIQSLLADPDRRRQMGKWGRDYVLAEFSYQRMTKLTLASYEKALAAFSLSTV